MAILPEQARAWADRQGSQQDLQKAICERLLADDPLPVGHGRLEEFPEDVVIALLQDENLDRDQLRAVVLGWRDAHHEVQSVFADPEFEPDQQKRAALAKTFTRVFRVAEATGHKQLRYQVLAALRAAIAEDHIEPQQRETLPTSRERFSQMGLHSPAEHS